VQHAGLHVLQALCDRPTRRLQCASAWIVVDSSQVGNMPRRIGSLERKVDTEWAPIAFTLVCHPAPRVVHRCLGFPEVSEELVECPSRCLFRVKDQMSKPLSNSLPLPYALCICRHLILLHLGSAGDDNVCDLKRYEAGGYCVVIGQIANRQDLESVLTQSFEYSIIALSGAILTVC